MCLLLGAILTRLWIPGQALAVVILLHKGFYCFIFFEVSRGLIAKSGNNPGVYVDLEILFDDNHCLVVVKPTGVSTGRDHRGEDSFIELVRAVWQKRKEALAGASDKKGYLVPIHFLDRPVSGVMLFALSSKAAARFNQQFRQRTVKKSYLALVEGIPHDKDATLSDFLLKDHDKNLVTVVDGATPGAKPCQLSYDRLAINAGRALLQVTLHTGRSHQIRVQLSQRGWPIAGDVKYGGEPLPEGRERLCLHAYRLQFTHPTLRTEMCFTAPLPDFWHTIWHDIQKIVP